MYEKFLIKYRLKAEISAATFTVNSAVILCKFVRPLREGAETGPRTKEMRMDSKKTG